MLCHRGNAAKANALNRRAQTSAKAQSTYYDRVDTNTSYNRLFYVFALGSYVNVPIYVYGETEDLLAVELELKRSVPMYRRLVCQPASDMMGVCIFEERCRSALLTSAPLLGEQFTALTADSPSDVLAWVAETYRVKM